MLKLGNVVAISGLPIVPRIIRFEIHLVIFLESRQIQDGFAACKMFSHEVKVASNVRIIAATNLVAEFTLVINGKIAVFIDSNETCKKFFTPVV